MLSIDYDSIFSDFLGNFTDYDFAQQDITNANLQMGEWLHKALAKPHLTRLFSSVILNDEIQIITVELVHMTDKDDESKDKDFVCDVIAKGMVVEWLRPQVNTHEAIRQFFGGSEQKFYSQANHLSELRALYKDAKEEFEAMIRDRGAIYNSYLEDET